MPVFLCFPNVTSPFKGRTGLTASLQHYLVITALGADRPGIVNTITRHVSSCGCNIEDSRLAMLVMSLRLSCCFPGHGMRLPD
jgi:glycine cleavage system transcriptional repressor